MFVKSNREYLCDQNFNNYYHLHNYYEQDCRSHNAIPGNTFSSYTLAHTCTCTCVHIKYNSHLFVRQSMLAVVKSQASCKELLFTPFKRRNKLQLHCIAEQWQIHLAHLPTASKCANISLNKSLRCSTSGSVLGTLSLGVLKFIDTIKLRSNAILSCYLHRNKYSLWITYQ